MGVQKSNLRKGDTVMSYEITKTVAVLSQYDDGSTLELNLIRWFGRPEKYDLRRWARMPNGDRVELKGIKLSHHELMLLRDILNMIHEGE